MASFSGLRAGGLARFSNQRNIGAAARIKKRVDVIVEIYCITLLGKGRESSPRNHGASPAAGLLCSTSTSTACRRGRSRVCTRDRLRVCACDRRVDSRLVITKRSACPFFRSTTCVLHNTTRCQHSAGRKCNKLFYQPTQPAHVGGDTHNIPQAVCGGSVGPCKFWTVACSIRLQRCGFNCSQLRCSQCGSLDHAIYCFCQAPSLVSRPKCMVAEPARAPKRQYAIRPQNAPGRPAQRRGTSGPDL